MILALDTNSLSFVDPENFGSPVPIKVVRRSDDIPILIQLIMDGGIVTPLDASLELFVTVEGDYTSLLASVPSFTIEGSGVEGGFVGDLDLGVAAVDALFTDGTVADAAAILEVRITDGDGVITSLPLNLTIQNSYIAP